LRLFSFGGYGLALAALALSNAPPPPMFLQLLSLGKSNFCLRGHMGFSIFRAREVQGYDHGDAQRSLTTLHPLRATPVNRAEGVKECDNGGMNNQYGYASSPFLIL